MISFEGAWCASNALANSCFAVSSSIRCHPQTGLDSAYSLDPSAASPLSSRGARRRRFPRRRMLAFSQADGALPVIRAEPPIHCATRERSEEHTSELQSRLHLVCRLL